MLRNFFKIAYRNLPGNKGLSFINVSSLATDMAENHLKEIGVRRELGASVQSTATLLSKDFIKLVLISIVIGSPVEWWAMNKWLSGYNYRINISWLIFIEAGLPAIVIALLTVSFRAIKAAIANPVKSLRTE